MIFLLSSCSRSASGQANTTHLHPVVPIPVYLEGPFALDGRHQDHHLPTTRPCPFEPRAAHVRLSQIGARDGARLRHRPEPPACTGTLDLGRVEPVEDWCWFGRN